MASLLKSKNKVHIFSTGKWNGQDFSESDLDEMVSAFNDTKGKWQPPGMKLGHDEEQAFLQKEGLPAAGWLDSVYRIGNKLYADFIDIPEKIYQLIEKGAYRRVSIEKYSNVKYQDRTYRHMIGAVALLGADFPGVMDLNDFLSLYNYQERPTIKSVTSDKSEVSINRYSFEIEKPQEGTAMTEAEIQALKAQLEIEKQKREAAEGEATKFKASADSEKAKAEKAEREKAEAEKKVFAAEEASRKAEIEKQVQSLTAEKKITKGMEPLVFALLDKQPEAEKFSIKSGDKTTEYTKFELIKELTDLFAKMSDVNLQEGSLEGKPKVKDNASAEAVQAYMAEHKVDFDKATRAVMRESLKGKESKED